MRYARGQGSAEALHSLGCIAVDGARESERLPGPHRRHLIGGFRAQFGGAVLTSQDADYETARHVWNGVIDRRRDVIARCVSAGTDPRQAAEVGDDAPASRSM